MHTDRAAAHWPPQVNNCFMGVRMKAHRHGSHTMAATVEQCFVGVRLQAHRGTKVTHARKMLVNGGLAAAAMPDCCKASKWTFVLSWAVLHDSR